MAETMTAQETTAAYQALPYVRYGEPGYNEYAEAQNNILNQFKAFLHNTYLEDCPGGCSDVVYDHAYSEGHASGFGGIENYYSEISNTATRVVDIRNRS